MNGNDHENTSQELRKHCNETTPLSKNPAGYAVSRNTHAHDTGALEANSFETSNQMQTGGFPRSGGFTPAANCSENVSCNEFSITNPFEAHTTIDSFLQPSFSPSVFGNASKSDNEKHKSESFWSIDEIAVLKPVDIDLSLLHKQEDFVVLDPETEKKAQQAIEKYFSYTSMTSPWSGEKPKPYLALISPSPCSMKRLPLVKSNATGSSSSASSLSMSSQINLQRFKEKSRLPPHIEDVETKIEATNTKMTHKKSVTVSTQTVLTLPVKFDLEKVLSEYFTYHHDGRISSEGQVAEVLSNSSLRRKLFFHDQEMTDNDNLLTDDNDTDALPLSADDPKTSDSCFIFPTENMIRSNLLTPVKQKYGESWNGTGLTTPSSQVYRLLPQTPSTCHSHFSSSPFTGGSDFYCDLQTPCSGYNESPNLNSAKRSVRLKGNSSDEAGLITPGVSPVLESNNGVFKSGQFFDGISKNSDSPILPSSVSKRNLSMDSPPVSPIEPIMEPRKIQNSSSVVNFKCASQGMENSSQLPALNLSPIDSTSYMKNGNIRSEKAAFELEPSTPDSSKNMACNKHSEKIYTCSSTKHKHFRNKKLETMKEIDINIAQHNIQSNKQKSSSYFPPPAICSSAIFTAEDMSSSDAQADNQNIDLTRSVVLDTASRHHTMCESISMQYESREATQDKCAINDSTNDNEDINELSNNQQSSEDKYISNDLQDEILPKKILLIDEPVLPCDDMSVDMSFGENKENILIEKYPVKDALKSVNEMEISLHGPSAITENSPAKSNNVHSVDSGCYSATSQHTRNCMETG